MQIETLRLFCDLVEASSFSMAAEKHHITQSAVSQRIRALEKELDATLLVRSRAIEVTPEGRLFLRAAHEMLETYDDCRRQLREMGESTGGDLKIAAVYSIGLHELPPYLKLFRDQHPDVEVKVSYRRANQVYADVADDRADVGLVAFPEGRGDLMAETFWQDELVLICAPGHRLAGETSISLEKLQNERFIAFEPDLPTQKAILAMMERARISVNEVMQLDNVEMVKRAVEVEDAVSIVPQRTAYAEVEAGLLHQVPLDVEEGKIRPLGLIRKQTRPGSRAVSEFVELLKTRRLF